MPNRPIPRNLRIVRKPTAEDERQPANVPAPPDYLSEAARSHWSEIARAMVNAKTYQPAFERTLATYCELLAAFFADPENFGPTRLSQMRLIAGDLGLTPSHAHRVSRA